MYLEQQLDRMFFTEESIKELKKPNSNFRFPNSAPPLRFIYELCWTLIKGELPFQSCKAALQGVSVSEEEVGSDIADVVVQIGQDATVLAGEQRCRLIKLQKWLVESGLVPLRLFQERSDDDLLQESEMIKIEKEDWTKKKTRVKTRMHYQQTKFNLLREDSQGYAKLLTLLSQPPQTSSTACTIKSLIGHFNLDPNRVLDILLECFQLQEDDIFLLELIPVFSKSQASQVLEFKFKSNNPPSTLFRVTALMIKHDLVDMDAILSYLLPSPRDDATALCARRLDEASKIGKINLTATGKDLMDDEQGAADMSLDLYAALDMENEAVSERLPELQNNQAFDLLMGLLAVEDWHHARILLATLDNPVEHVQISDALFRLIDKSCANSNHFFEMLKCVGPFMYRDTVLLQKVCRAVKNASITRFEEALGKCLLPSLHMVPANPGVGHEIWELLNLLPFEARYRLYGEWEKDDEQVPMILAARQVAKLDTRRILKRLAKENSKTLGRMLAKLAHANPITVLRTIVQQVEAYKDMIPPVVDALKYLTQLEFDVLEYVVIERLAGGGREKLKDDGLNLSDWLQSLASFWGHVCRKHPSKVYMRGLFQYLANQLKRGHGIELVLLQQLIQQMANIEHTENITEDQLLATIKKNKSANNRLRDALLDSKLAVPLLLLVGQHRSAVVINADAPHIKMVSEEFDRCNGILLQYVEFLSTSVSSYALLIPTLDELVNVYHLEPEVAFLIHRPAMKKPISCSDLPATVTRSLCSLSPDLYAAFWGLTLYDVHVPRKRYESEMGKQHAALKALEEAADNSSSEITKRKREKEGAQQTLDGLAMELQKREDHVASVLRHLAREKDALKMNMEFLEKCIYPRCTFSMHDAVYCAMFVNALGTPFVGHMDSLICKTLKPMVCCSTEYETGRLGRFLLETAEHWKRMEGRMARILIRCLESSEYMETRNGLILLTKICSVFPVTRNCGMSLEKRVEKMRGDEREDLKVLAAGVGAALAARKASWITDEPQKRASPCEEADKRRKAERGASVEGSKSRSAQQSLTDERSKSRSLKRAREDDREWEQGQVKRPRPAAAALPQHPDATRHHHSHRQRH